MNIGKRVGFLVVVAGFAASVGVVFAVPGGVSASALSSDSITTADIIAETGTTNDAADSALSRLDYGVEPRMYVLGKLTTSGLKVLNSDLILGTTGLAVGDSIVIPGDRLNLAARRLWNQNHFSDVKVETSFHGDTVDVNIRLAERRRVTKWEFEGVKSGAQKDLAEKLKLRRNGELSDYRIATSLKLIRDYYDEKGFRNADINYRIENDPARPANVIVTFTIDRGKKVRIKEIQIEGTRDLAYGKMLRSMKNTHKKGINFFQNTKFKESDFVDDRENLINFFKSKGYRDAQIVADSLFDIDAKNMGIWIKIDQGKKYYYRDISWIGNTVFQTKNLNDLLLFSKGDTYDSESMQARLGINGKGEMGAPAVSSLYLDDGYLAFTVEPVETVVGDSVDLQIRIVEGKQFRIKDVSFTGNTRTNDHVVRRELYTRPGELYSQSLLMRSYQRLATMGQFDPSSFQAPEVVPDMQQETVDIRYALVEKSNDQFELSGGWGGGMFVASVGIKFTNVSVRNLFKKGAWRPYPAGDNQSIGISVQTNGTYYRAASLSFTEPWLGGRKPNSLNVSFHTSRETNAYTWGQKPTAYFGTIGGSVGFGKRLSWPDPYFTLSAGVSFQSYNMNNWTNFILRNGRANTLALSVSIGRNSVDDPMLYSTQGSDISLTLALTPPYSLFSKRDYSDPTMTDQERYRWIEYHKWTFNAKWFFPLTQDRKLVFMARVQMGFLGFYNKNRKSPFEGFQVGGDGLTGFSMYGVETIGLRGYDNGSLTPYGEYGLYSNAFTKYTAELRYPLVRESGTMIYGLVFAEAGNAFESIRDFNPFDLKRSAGVGIRVYLPVLGLLGVDWGWGFDKVRGSSKAHGSQFHVSIGSQF